MIAHASPRRTVLAVAAVFWVNGATYGSWVVRLPELREAAGLSIPALGLVLAAAQVGGIAGTPLAPWLQRRFGSRTLALTCSLATALVLFTLGITASAVTLVASLLAFGFNDSLADIAMNTQAVRAEEAHGRSVMNRIHGAWSLGTVLGGLGGSAAADRGTSLSLHLGLTALVLVMVSLAAAPHLLVETGEEADDASLSLRPTRPLLMIGAASFAVLSLEILPVEWGATILSEVHGAASGPAGLAVTASFVGMTIGRFAGDVIVERLGGRRALLGGVTVSAVASGAAVLAPGANQATLALIVGGLGMSVVFPQLYRLAGTMPGLDPAVGLGALAAGSRLGGLVGAPAVGGLTAVASLSLAVPLVALFMATVAVLATLGLGRGDTNSMS